MAKQKNTQKEDKSLRTSPKPFILGGILVIILFFGGMAAWSAFLPFSGAVIAPGTVEVSREKKTVQHLEGGIVDEIYVQEGNTVEKGQALIKLQGPEVDASVSLLQGQLWSKIANLARLQAESRMADAIDWPDALTENRDKPEVAEVMEKEEAIFNSRRGDLEGQISLIYSQIGQLKEQIQGAKEELNAQEEIISTLKEEIDIKQALFADNYIDKAQLLELKRKLAERKGRSGRLKQDIAETQGKIEELRRRIVNLKNKYKETALSELGKVQDTVFELREKLTPKLDAKDRLTITAPIAGEVMNLKVHSEKSGVIQPAQPILEIVPRNAELVVEAQIQPDKITNVKKGQKTRVQLSAFNRRTTPPVRGEVIYVSADQMQQETSAGKQPFYIVHIKINPGDLQQSGAYLSPGMPAVCYIETEKRTIVNYLLDPILEVMDQSLRES